MADTGSPQGTGSEVGSLHALFLRSSPAIQDVLGKAEELAVGGAIPPNVANAAAVHLGAATVPYTVLRDVWLHSYPKHLGIRFHQLVAESAFALKSPEPRVKGPDLVDRLSKLQDLADRKAYEELVSDITVPRREYFSTYKEQFGFGVHVLVTMGTCYLFGYGLFRSIFQNNPVIHVAGGVVGLVLGMFLETSLYIIRVSRYEKHLEKKVK